MFRKTFFLLVLALPLTGCGGSDFAGTWQGPLKIATTCSGSTTTTTSPSSLTITQSGSTATIVLGGGCSNAMGTVNNNTITMGSSQCPASSNGGPLTFTGGTLTLVGSNLDVLLNANATQSGGGMCTVVSTGTFTKL